MRIRIFGHIDLANEFLNNLSFLGIGLQLYNVTITDIKGEDKKLTKLVPLHLHAVVIKTNKIQA